MSKKPEAIEIRSGAEVVGETLLTPASSMARAIESMVMMIQKVNDLGDARKAIGEATKLHKKGDKDKARELTMGIFQRLKKIGKAPEKLDIGSVQEQIKLGKFEELSKSLKGVQNKGTAKRETITEKLVDEVGEIPDKSNAEQVEIKKKIENQVKKRREAIKSREEEVQGEFVELLTLVKGEEKAGVDAEIAGIEAQIKSGMVGEVNLPIQITKLKEKIKITVRKRIEDSKGDARKSNAEIAGNLSDNPKDVLGKMAEKVKNGKVGERAFFVRLQHLVEGMDKIQDGVDGGLGIQEAIRVLDPKEIREVRALLASPATIPDSSERSPYYDQRYVELIDGMDLSSDEVVGLVKMLDSIDVHYQKEQRSKPVDSEIFSEEQGKRKDGGGFVDGAVMVDEEGNPIQGMDMGMMTPEQAEAVYQESEERFRELFEEMSDGSFREIGLEEQLVAKKKQHALITRERGLQQLVQRESFLNINMQNLFRYMEAYDKRSGTGFAQMIDHEYYLANGVAKLKDEYMTPSSSKEKKLKKDFESWWYQEASFNQRSLAYEGLFERRNQSPRMQRLNSLMEIIGVGTEKKGLANWMSMSYGTVDQQNNSYVNAEFMGKLAEIWTKQGVDWRLEDSLKEYREEICPVENGERGKARGTISVFDTVSFMQKHITDSELRGKLGIPEWWKGKYGTMMYKYSDGEQRSEARRIIWDHFLEKELGVDLSGLDMAQQDNISNKYQLMFDLGFQYSVVHKQLHMMLGNASFAKNKYELPAACAEMHVKLDPILYSRAFAPRYNWLSATFKEGWALFDPGVRDYVTMAKQDYASHFTVFDEKNPTALKTDNGSATILATYFDSASVAEQKGAEELYEIFDKTMWHWGAGKQSGMMGHEVDVFMEWGVDGDKASAYRRPAGEMATLLASNMPSKETLVAINWDKYCEIAKNPRITEYLKGSHTPKEKWMFFAKTFGEHSYNHSSPSAKRSGDHPIKYGVEKFNDHVEAFMGWIQDPFNSEKFDSLLDTPAAVNAGAVPGMAKKNLEFLITMTELMGRSELGGGSMKRLFRDPETGMAKFDTSQGIGGDGDNEYPAFAVETIKNNKKPFDPVQHKSIPGSVGIGIPKDKQIILDLINAQRTKGRLPDNLYRDMYKGVVNSVFVEPKLGPIVNAYRWMTLEPILEWLGPQMGITGHELRHILTENTEKTIGNFWKYLSS